MLIKENQRKVDVSPKLRDGKGDTRLELLEKMPEAYRLAAEIVLKPGCSIGKHYHNGETELYWMLSGTAIVDDNGTIINVSGGDAVVCYDGDYHSIENAESSKEDVHFLALVIAS